MRNRDGDWVGGLQCSFCSKIHDEVKMLIAGPKTYICDECVYLCIEIYLEHAANGDDSVTEVVQKLRDRLNDLRRDVSLESKALTGSFLRSG